VSSAAHYRFELAVLVRALLETRIEGSPPQGGELLPLPGTPAVSTLRKSYEISLIDFFADLRAPADHLDGTFGASKPWRTEATEGLRDATKR
jgi:hypothetical protein